MVPTVDLIPSTSSNLSEYFVNKTYKKLIHQRAVLSIELHQVHCKSWPPHIHTQAVMTMCV